MIVQPFDARMQKFVIPEPFSFAGRKAYQFAIALCAHQIPPGPTLSERVQRTHVALTAKFPDAPAAIQHIEPDGIAVILKHADIDIAALPPGLCGEQIERISPSNGPCKARAAQKIPRLVQYRIHILFSGFCGNTGKRRIR